MIWFFLVACHGSDSDETSGSPSMLVDGVLAFENVEIGSPRVETLWVENVGTGVLFVDVPYFAEDSAFSVPNESVTLERMEAYGYDVTFDPRTPFLHEGWLVLESDDPAGSSRRVAVRGEAFAPVLEVSTSRIDFGTTDVSCVVHQEIEVRNDGNEPLVVTPSLAGSSEFVLGSDDPFMIEPSTSMPILVTYRSADAATDVATLTLESNDPLRPETMIDVTAAGSDLATRTDTFEMGPRKTDAVFVVDNSESMGTEQQELADHIGAFVDGLEARMVDYRIGVITTDQGSFQGPVVTDAIGARSLDEEIEAIGTDGSGTQRALQMLYNCVQSTGDCSEASGFLRDDALFAGIIVSDNPDQSALTPEAYVDYFATLKGAADHVRIHAIAGAVPVQTCLACASAGFGYDWAVELTLGQYVDICTTDWDGALTTLAEQSLGAYQPLMILEALPVVESIVVEVDRVVTKSGWIYTGYPLAGGTNEIQFDPESLPVPGSRIDVRYSVAPVCE
jgi:hypothetical protein